MFNPNIGLLSRKNDNITTKQTWNKHKLLWLQVKRKKATTNKKALLAPEPANRIDQNNKRKNDTTQRPKENPNLTKQEQDHVKQNRNQQSKQNQPDETKTNHIKQTKPKTKDQASKPQTKKTNKHQNNKPKPNPNQNTTIKTKTNHINQTDQTRQTKTKDQTAWPSMNCVQISGSKSISSLGVSCMRGDRVSPETCGFRVSFFGSRNKCCLFDVFFCIVLLLFSVLIIKLFVCGASIFSVGLGLESLFGCWFVMWCSLFLCVLGWVGDPNDEGSRSKETINKKSQPATTTTKTTTTILSSSHQ